MSRVPFPEFVSAYTQHMDNLGAGPIFLPFATKVMRYLLLTRPSPASTANTADAVHLVTSKEFDLFLKRFGPMRLSFKKAANSGFATPDSPLEPWFHGNVRRSEASPSARAGVSGAFLIRFSEHHPSSLTLVYSRYMEGPPDSGRKKIPKLEDRHCLIYNHGEQGYALVPDPPKTDRLFKDLRHFIAQNSKRLVSPVPSKLFLDSREYQAQASARHGSEAGRAAAAAEVTSSSSAPSAAPPSAPPNLSSRHGIGSHSPSSEPNTPIKALPGIPRQDMAPVINGGSPSSPYADSLDAPATPTVSGLVNHAPPGPASLAPVASVYSDLGPLVPSSSTITTTISSSRGSNWSDRAYGRGGDRA